MKKIFIAALFLGALFNSNIAFAQTETSGREKVYRATHTKTTELKHTKLKVNFDYQKEQMNGEEWLTASPYFYPQPRPRYPIERKTPCLKKPPLFCCVVLRPWP